MRTTIKLVAAVGSTAKSPHGAIRSAKANNAAENLVQSLHSLYGQQLVQAFVSDQEVRLVMSLGKSLRIKAEDGRVHTRLIGGADQELEISREQSSEEPLTILWGDRREMWPRRELLHDYFGMHLRMTFTDGDAMYLYFVNASQCLSFVAVKEEDTGRDFLYWFQTR